MQSGDQGEGSEQVGTHGEKRTHDTAGNVPRVGQSRPGNLLTGPPASKRPSHVSVIVVALLAVTAVTGFKLLFPKLLGVEKPFLGYFVAVLATAWYAGMAGGIVATAFATLAATYFFVGHRYSFAADDIREYVPVVVFVVECLLISYLCSLLHAAYRRAEGHRQALRESEQQYRLMVENVRDYAMFMTDRENRVVRWNTGAERLFGWTADGIVGQPAAVIFTPEDRERGAHLQELETAERDGHAADERWHQRKDGSRFFASGMKMRVDDEAGHHVGFTKVVRDVTDRKLAESRLRTEHAVAVALAGATTLKEAMPGVLEAICRVAEWDWGGLWAVNPEDGVLRWAAGWHDPSVPAAEFVELSRRLTLAPGVGLPGRVWASSQPAWVTDVAQEANFPRREVAVRAGLHGAICFPLVSGGEVLAVMEFFSRQVRPPNEQLLVMMQVIGGQVAEFVRRREAEESLHQAEARQAAVVAAALDCIVAMDHTGRVVGWNPAAERTFGYTKDEAIGREMADLIIPPSLRERHRQGLVSYLAGGEGPVIGNRIEITGVRKGGDEFPVELTVTRLPSDGPPTFTGFVRDITDRKTAERERDRLLASEQRARAEAEAALNAAERANRLKDEFLATVSHELRTPLNAVLGWATLLRSGHTDPDDLRQGLDTIERNARAQAVLIEDILDVSRIVTGKLRLDAKPMELAPVVEQAVESVRPAADAKGIRIEREIDPDAGFVLGDTDRLQQVVWNLLSNAVKFTDKGGTVRVRVGRTESKAQVVVSDTGRGIPADFLPYVFDRFRQADATTTRQKGGLGLGLAIARHLVELHGGEVAADSPGEGMGATFTVRLPLRAVRHETPSAPTQQPTFDGSGMAAVRRATDCPPSLRGLRVLVVDDDQDARFLLTRVLENCEAEVTAVGSVAEAFAAMRGWTPQLLISDIGMPDEDGYALIRKLRTLEAQEDGYIPAIALTAYASTEDRRRAMTAGFQTHLAKPITPAELTAAVENLTGGTPSHR